MNTHWQWKRLGDVCKTSSGGTPLRDRAEYFEGGQVPWLMSGEVAQGDVTKSENFITKLGMQNSAAKLFPVGTVLVAMYGATAGQVGVLRFEATTNQAVCGIFPTAHFIPEFLFYFFLSRKSELVAQATGNAQPNISQAKIKDTLVPLLPLEEQRRIVAVLDEAFAAIATATANAEKNLVNARELFEASVRDTFADPDPSWELMTLKEAARDFGRGKSKHRPRNDPKLYGGVYPFIQTGDVRNSDHLITQYSQTYSEAGLTQSKLWPRGTICITIAANIAETGILDFDACFPDSVIGMVVDPARTSNSYVEYLLQSLKAVLQDKGKGSAQANINLATFENERFPFPPKAVQLDIVARLGALSEQVQVMQALYADKLIALGGLKQSLLHRAFTGDLTATMPETLAA